MGKIKCEIAIYRKNCAKFAVPFRAVKRFCGCLPQSKSNNPHIGNIINYLHKNIINIPCQKRISYAIIVMCDNCVTHRGINK